MDLGRHPMYFGQQLGAVGELGRELERRLLGERTQGLVEVRVAHASAVRRTRPPLLPGAAG